MSTELTFRKKGTHDYFALIGREYVAHAELSAEKRYIRRLVVAKPHRRKGYALALIRHIVSDLGYKLNRAPNEIKNDAVRSLSVQLGDELLEEAPREKD